MGWMPAMIAAVVLGQAGAAEEPAPGQSTPRRSALAQSQPVPSPPGQALPPRFEPFPKAPAVAPRPQRSTPSAPLQPLGQSSPAQLPAVRPLKTLPGTLPPLDTPTRPSVGSELVPLTPSAAQNRQPGDDRAAVDERAAADERTQRATALVAVLSKTPEDLAFEGTQLSLVQLLDGAVRDRAPTEKLAVVHRYWQLAAAVARHNVEAAYLERLAALGAVDTATETALAAASARALLEESRLAVATSQHHLAADTGAAELVLPLDRLHAGVYFLQFRLVFASRVAPAEAVRLSRTLPLRQQALSRRGDAYRLADRAVDLSLVDVRSGRLTLTAAASRMRRWRDLGIAFVDAAQQYNEEIARYAFLAAGGADSASLARMLVKHPAGLPAGNAGQVIQATNTEPAAARPSESPPATSPRQAIGPLPAEGAPTTLPTAPTRRVGPFVLPPSLPPRATTPAPPAQRRLPGTQASPDRTVPGGLAPTTPAPGGNAPQSDRGAGVFPFAPVPGAAPAADRRPPVGGVRSILVPQLSPPGSQPPQPATTNLQANKPLVPLQNHARASKTDAKDRYSELAGLAAAQRIGRLAAMLHWDHQASGDQQQPVLLQECLRGVAVDRRLDVLTTYWRLRREIAALELERQEEELLASLLLDIGDARQASMGLAETWLAACQLAAEATWLESRADLLAGELRLTQESVRSDSGSWLRPSTPPHAGRYQVEKSQPLDPRAERVEALYKLVVRRGQLVLETERLRTQTIEGFGQGRVSLDDLAAAIDVQRDEALAFLSAIERYNVAIADYVLNRVAVDLPPAQFVQYLVVRDEAREPGTFH